MPSTYFVGWWNLENLFDEENAPPERRSEKVRRVLGRDIEGWTPQRRDRKISQLASVIARLNDGAGPDLLGVCEVENRFVLDLLVDDLAQRPGGREYAVVHADTSDARGIDVAFLYDPTMLTVPDDATFFHVVMRCNATREIVQVNFRTRAGLTWTVFGNHWPSRTGGQAESAGFRHIAAETLAFFHERALEVHGSATPVLAMGDFNDEPFDTSLVLHALSTRQRQKVLQADEVPRLWNLSWPALGVPAGTFYFDNQPNVLDQVLVNKNMSRGNGPMAVDPASVTIVAFDDMTTGSFRKPRPFGGMGKPVDDDGFSDHFPVTLIVME